mmetsp:Transcript_3708/g.10216  ORF Transcript_3708/g.10216 Transcript_3708/m.10216 type:complete len:1861 (+) Transcript_3708:82-5664(+)
MVDNEQASPPLSNMVKTTKTAAGTDLRRLYGDFELHPIVHQLSNEANTNKTTTTALRHSEQEDQQRQWASALVSWYEEHEKAQNEASSSRGRKSRFKRPREVPALPDLPLPPTKVQALITHNDSNGMVDPIPPEQSQWRLLVDMSAGQASKRMRERKRKLRSGKGRGDNGVVSNTDGQLWRKLCREERIDATNVAVTGDFRIGSEKTLCASRQSLSNWSGSTERRLKAILSCANAYVAQMNQGPPMTASSILYFCQHVDNLVPHEEVSYYSSPMVKQINEAMNSLALAARKARKLRAHWMDLWFEEGVDLETIRKSLTSAGSTNVQPDELGELTRQLGVVTAWQRRMDELRSSPRSGRNDVTELEAMRDEAKASHAFRSKGLVALETRLEKSYQLSEKIMEWKGRISRTDEQRETVKFLSAIVREINRLKIHFPAAEFALDLSQATEAWVDRANIAIRSRISLAEIKDLIARGQQLPLQLSDYLDKLESRKAVAEEWLSQLVQYVPLPDEKADGSLLSWMTTVRSKLDEGGWVLSSIHDLACEGSRIPVEMDCVKLLQVELDARNWSVKARRWLPDASNADVRKGKLEDIQEHVEKATSLRQRLVLPATEKLEWKLEGEEELQNIVNNAENWLDMFKDFIEGGCRRSAGRSEVSIVKLREIVNRGNSIHVNLGPPGVKMSKILSQADAWHKAHNSLIVRSKSGDVGEKVTLDNLREAVEDAKANIGVLDLKEAVDLQNLVVRIEEWLERASVAIGGKKKKGKSKLVFGIKDLQQLIKDGKDFPISTDSEIAQLENLVGAVINWQAFARRNMDTISAGFQQVKHAIDAKYGPAAAFSPRNELGMEKSSQETTNPKSEGVAADDQNSPPTPTGLELGSECEALIKIISQDSKNSCIVTPEAEVAQHLEDIARWTARSVKYIDNRREIFDSRFFGAFDRFRKEGETLVRLTAVGEDDSEHQLAQSWRVLTTDQLERMNVLLKEREAFAAWCRRADELISAGDKKLTIEKLNELAKAGSRFPTENEAVSSIQDLVKRCETFSTKVKTALEAKERMSLNEAKTTLEEGNRLGVLSKELRMLRSGVKEARGWSNKVKRIKPEQGQAQFRLVKALLEEYDGLIVSLPEEHKQLSHAMKNYCVCRRPFEGTMVKCEHCQDWYHAACVGISQARAEKKPINNYVCVRCLMKKVFDQSTAVVANILRKWTSEADLKKARLIDFQRHQRKARRETKELEKLRAEAQKLTEEVSKLKAPEVEPNPVAQETTSADPIEPTTSQPNQFVQQPTELNPMPPVLSQPNPVVPVPSQTTPIVPVTTHPNPIAPLLSQPNPASPMTTKPSPIALAAGKTNTAAPATNPIVPVPSQTSSTAPLGTSKDPSPGAKLAPPIQEEKRTQEDLAKSIEKVTASIKLCQSRLQDLHEAGVRQKNEEEIENVKADALKRWCVRIRSLVIAPSLEDQAKNSCPPTNGTLSPPMISLIQEAEKYELMRYADVKSIFNAFKCICWSSQAMETLSRQPIAADAVALVRNAAKINLPCEKGLRMLKSMTQRATTWNFKASRLMTPIPGEKSGFDMRELKNLASLADDIPFRMNLEQRLHAVIDDNGNRHCVCGGPSDGRMMLCCDKCDVWFHSNCVGLSTKEASAVEEWICPPCNGKPVDVTPDLIKGFHDAFGKVEEDELSSSSLEDDDVCPKAPTVKALWPPFGLLGSTRSIESLGQNLCSLPDDLGQWDGTPSLPTAGVVSVANHQSHRTVPTKHIQKAPPQPPRLLSLPASVVAVGNSHPIPTAPVVVAMPATNMAAQPHAPATENQTLRPNQMDTKQTNGATGPSTQASSHEKAAPPPDDEHIRESVAQLLAMRNVMVAPMKNTS